MITREVQVSLSALQFFIALCRVVDFVSGSFYRQNARMDTYFFRKVECSVGNDQVFDLLGHHTAQR